MKRGRAGHPRSSEVGTGSREENASNQNLEPRFDSIETEKALEQALSSSVKAERHSPATIDKIDPSRNSVSNMRDMN
jgi:hypothetical protein